MKVKIPGPTNQDQGKLACIIRRSRVSLYLFYPHIYSFSSSILFLTLYISLRHEEITNVALYHLYLLLLTRECRVERDIKSSPLMHVRSAVESFKDVQDAKNSSGWRRFQEAGVVASAPVVVNMVLS